MRALLIGVSLKDDFYDINYSLDELKNLAKTLDIEVVDKVIQKLDKINNKTYVGLGKLKEILLLIATLDIDLLICNDELSASQIKNISEITNIECIDRSYLILQIFEKRAMTKESKLEIELAKNMYLLPRIQTLKDKEERVSGIGLRGKGETQKELDSRHIRSEISHLQDEINKLNKMKQSQIEKRKRNDIPIVCLVGYTNSGKSSTMNTILNYINKEDKQVLAKDQLFATLQTFNRKITYNKVDFMLTDTIGFVSKLPHHLVASFYQTLEEVKHADLIIHVIDSSSEYKKEQFYVVEQVLDFLNTQKIPTIYLLNKWDKNDNLSLTIPGKKCIPFSNVTKFNIDELMSTILEYVTPSSIRVRLLIPYSKGDLANIIEKNSQIYHKEYQSFGTYYDIELPIKLYSIFREYDLDLMVS